MTFVFFKKAADQRGFYEVLQRTFSEFKHYGVTEDLLQAKQEQLKMESSSSSLLIDKLYDLQHVYGTLNESLRGKYIDSDDYLTFAAEKIAKWSALQEATIYMDGFESFTSQEWELIKPLMVYGKKVTLTLTLDPEQLTQRDVTELSLFKRAMDTYRTLTNYAKEWSISIETPVVFLESKRFMTPTLKHLEAVYEKRPYQKLKPVDRAVSLVEATNRRTEIEEVARQIQTLVMEEDARFRDIAVLVRDLSTYRDLIETIFTDYKIPLFNDQKPHIKVVQ